MANYRELRQEQQAKIKQLEQEVMQQRHEHSEQLQQRKAQFIDEKQQVHVRSHNKIAEMGAQANKEAEQQLVEYALKTRADNRNLRQTLLALINKSRATQERIRQLQAEQRQLLAEQKLAHDMRTLKQQRLRAADGDGDKD